MDSFPLQHAGLVEFGPNSVGRSPSGAVLFPLNSSSQTNRPVNRSHTASHSLLRRPAPFGWKKCFLNSNKIFFMNGILLRFQRVFLWSKITHVFFNCSPTSQKRKQITIQCCFLSDGHAIFLIPSRTIPNTNNNSKQKSYVKVSHCNQTKSKEKKILKLGT